MEIKSSIERQFGKAMWGYIKGIVVILYLPVVISGVVFFCCLWLLDKIDKRLADFLIGE